MWLAFSIINFAALFPLLDFHIKQWILFVVQLLKINVQHCPLSTLERDFDGAVSSMLGDLAEKGVSMSTEEMTLLKN